MSKHPDPADSAGFVLLADYVPHIVQEIRYYSTYNFIGERIDGYEAPCALLTKEAARALKAASNELFVQGYRLKVFDAYRPA
ncbi:MAG: peptidase M15, partial [Clostridia bacterium]|nr:peptidase M15 [Clostridia bacterium]